MPDIAQLLRRSGCFWLIVLKLHFMVINLISLRYPVMVGACGEGNCIPYVNQKAKGEEIGVLMHPQQHTPNGFTSFHKAPPHKGSNTPQQSHGVVSQPSPHRPLKETSSNHIQLINSYHTLLNR